MDITVRVLFFISKFGLVYGVTCYSNNGDIYCSGYCSGTFGNQNCEQVSLSGDAIIGIVVGTIVCLGILITIMVAMCCCCMKNGKTPARVASRENLEIGISNIPAPPPYQRSFDTYTENSQQVFQSPPPPYSTISQPVPNVHHPPRGQRLPPIRSSLNNTVSNTTENNLALV